MKSSTIAVVLIVLVAIAGFWYWSQYMQEPMQEPQLQVQNDNQAQQTQGASVQVTTDAMVQTGTAEDDQGIGDASEPSPAQ